MDNHSRKERLEITGRLLKNSDFNFVKKEVEKDIQTSSTRLDILQSKGLLDEAQYEAGFKKGLEMALKKPEMIYRQSLSMMQRIEEALNVRQDI